MYNNFHHNPYPLLSTQSARILLCSISGPIKPAELPKVDVGPDEVSEELLLGHGYRKGPPDGPETRFVEIEAPPGTFHRVLHVVRVWEDATIGPGHSITIGPDELTVPCGWDQSAPSRDGIRTKIGRYLNGYTPAPAPIHG